MDERNFKNTEIFEKCGIFYNVEFENGRGFEKNCGF